MNISGRAITVLGRLGVSAGVLAAMLVAVVADAQEMRGAAVAQGEDVEAIETTADKLEYNRATGWIEAKGNVVVRQGDAQLKCNYARVNMRTEEAHAVGNVEFTRGDTVWTGSDLRYNFKTGQGYVDSVSVETDPFFINAESTERSPDGSFVMHHADITTCEFEDPHWHWHVRSRSLRVRPGDDFTAKHAAWFFGPVPVLYTPYWHRELNGDNGFRVEVGHDSDWGSFILSSYKYRMSPLFKGRTHVDYRTDRGVAFGQDLEWLNDRWDGIVRGYYANDDEPFDEEDDEARGVEDQRYRIWAENRVNMTDRDYALFQADYLSDVDMLEDFFEHEFKRQSEPENYATMTHRGEQYTANLRVSGRLNDFYESVNRTPEVSIDFLRQQIGDSSFYYEGQTAAAQLERVYPERRTNRVDYSAFRLDTEHAVYRPSRHFGWLNLVPRAGVRGTYYSQTRSQTTRQETSQREVVLEDGTTVLVNETNAVTVDVEQAGDIRSVAELGMEASFKAFKSWNDFVVPRRHIVEPYADYTLIPEPNLLREDLYQFDSVDRLEEENFVKLGVRNKVQIKVDERPFDVVDLDVYTRYRLDPKEDQETIDDFFADAEIRPHKWFIIDLDARYDTTLSQVEEFNTQLRVKPPQARWEGELEHRYEVDDSSLLSAQVTLYPNTNWAFNVYGRTELEESRTEEYACWVQRNLDCLSFRTGFSMLPGYTRTSGEQEEDEYRIIFEMWLKAFPESSLSAKHRQ